MTDVTINGNGQGTYPNGGGIYCQHSSPSLVNVSITNNTAFSGGGINFFNSNPSLENVTISDNLASSGGGIYCSLSSLNLINSILWNNSTEEIYFNQSTDSSSIAAYYSDIEGGQDSIVTNDNGTVTWGTGNIDVYPLFVDSANGDFNLTPDSRCIDTGHPDSTDADGTIADMGAYYYDQSSQPVRVKNLIATPSANNIALKWPANTENDLAGYYIYRDIDSNADFYNMSQYATAADSFYVDEGADESTTFHYRVSAVDADGDEGILAFARHGRTGNDTSALAMGADDRWISIS